MYIHQDHMPLSRAFPADDHLELILKAGRDGALGQSWTDENGAIIATGFFTYLLGKPTPGEALEQILPQACPYCAIPKSPEWLACLQSRPHRTCTRYKMSPPAQFDADHLQKLANTLPSGFCIRAIDRAMLESGIVTPPELNIPHAFGAVERYLATGFGFAVLKGNRAVSIASSYISHKGEVEVDISTEEDCRRLGLATAVCARFLLECMHRNVIPEWDAQNPESVALARKLGFTLSHPYDAYVLIP